MTRRRVLVGAALVVVVAAIAGAVLALRGGSSEYAQVASIERDARYQDAALLERAWALPVAATYRASFEAQGNGSFCGPTSVVNVMQSIGDDATQATVLEGTDISTVFGVLPGGITLDQLAELVRTRLPQRTVTLHRDLDLAAFRALLQRSNEPGVRMIANFHRGPLFARGGGHHSPIGGYLEAEDLVFVLDVNADYDPWLTTPERLFGAIDTVDSSSSHTRGLVTIE